MSVVPVDGGVSDTEPPGNAAGGRPASGAVGGRTDSPSYTIRPFRSADRDGYVRLHDAIFPGTTTEAWFAWKYEENPFVDEVPITVAERDGRFVGAVSSFPLELWTGHETVLANISCEAFVHPDHRRHGVFKQLVQTSWKRKEAAGIPFTFSLTANEKTLAGHRKHNDWQLVGTIPRSYRIQDPGQVIDSTVDRWPLGALGRLVAPAWRAVLDRRYRGGPDRRPDVSVRRHPDVPVDVLTSLYREHVPDELHAVRDERLYGWRFRNPNVDYAAYVARRGGTPVAAMVAGTRTLDGLVEVRVVDLVPLTPERREAETARLLEALLDDRAGAGLVTVLPGMVTERVRSRFGFVSQDRFPLSRVTRPIYHGVRPFAGLAACEVSRAALLDASSWRITPIEMDSS